MAKSSLQGENDNKSKMTTNRPTELEHMNSPGNDIPIWHYFDGVNQVGPRLEKEMRALIQNGEIGSDDLVWKEGTEKWITVENSELARFLDDRTNIPPPFESPAINQSPPRQIAMSNTARNVTILTKVVLYALIPIIIFVVIKSSYFNLSRGAVRALIFLNIFIWMAIYEKYPEKIGRLFNKRGM